MGVCVPGSVLLVTELGNGQAAFGENGSARDGLTHLSDCLKTGRGQFVTLFRLSFTGCYGLHMGSGVFENGLQLVALIRET